MEIPETDEDILGCDFEEINDVLKHRDEIIQNKLIPDLSETTSEFISSRSSSSSSVADIFHSLPIWQRVYTVFSSNGLLCDSDLRKQSSLAIRLPFYMGSCVGLSIGIMRAFSAYDEFVQFNKFTVYCTHEMGKRRAFDYAALKAVTLGLSVGSKVTFFTMGCFTIPLAITAARSKTSFWEYAAGWSLTCSLYCLSKGVKSMVVAGAVAAVPGLVFGTVNMFACRKLGLTFEDILAKQTNV